MACSKQSVYAFVQFTSAICRSRYLPFHPSYAISNPSIHPLEKTSDVENICEKVNSKLRYHASSLSVVKD